MQPYSINSQLEQPNNKFKEYFDKYATSKNLIIGAAAFIGVMFLILWYGWGSFKKTNIEFSITGPKDIVSAEETTFNIYITNKNRKTLINPEIIFHYPTGFVIKKSSQPFEKFGDNGIRIKLNQFRKGDSQEINIDAVASGNRGDLKNLSAELTYQPEGLSAYYENKAAFSFYIKFVTIAMTVNAPEKIFSNSEVSYLLNYVNNSDKTYDNLILEASYPNGFDFQKSEPIPLSDNNKWLIERLEPGKQGTLLIKGILSGQNNEVKSAIFSIKSGIDDQAPILNSIQADSLIKDLIFSVESDIDGAQENNSANLGDMLSFKIKYKNISEVNLSNVKIKIDLTNDIFNIQSLKNQSGYFDASTNSILWTSVNLPSLANVNAGDSGEIFFAIQLKNNIPVNQQAKNLVAKLGINIFTETPPIVFNVEKLEQKSEILIKIRTNATLKTKLFYIDPYSAITNNGLTPPKPGSETTYTAHWQITNPTNDIENAQIKTILPLGVKFTSKTSLTMGEISFNNQTNEVVWKINKLPAGTGFYRQLAEAVFQIAVTPNSVESGSYKTILNTSELTADEIFVNLPIIIQTQSIDTRLPDDVSHGGKVQ